MSRFCTIDLVLSDYKGSKYPSGLINDDEIEQAISDFRTQYSVPSLSWDRDGIIVVLHIKEKELMRLKLICPDFAQDITGRINVLSLRNLMDIYESVKNADIDWPNIDEPIELLSDD